VPTNPKLEIQKPKQIGIIGNGRNPKPKAGAVASKLQAISAILVPRAKREAGKES
jgi:hypothetical protein